MQSKPGVLREVTLAGRGLSHQLAHFRLEGLLVSPGLRQSAARGMSTTGIRRSRLSQTATAPAHALSAQQQPIMMWCKHLVAVRL